MNAVALITASLILLAGVIDDLRSKKVHNWLFLTCTSIALIAGLMTEGWPGLNTALLGFVAGIATLLPLVLLKVIGAGDMKLLAAFGAAAGWSVVVDVAVLSLIWGAIFGVMQVTLKGQLKATLANMLNIARMKDRSTMTLHKLPFTVALLMGWLSDLVYRGVLR